MAIFNKDTLKSLDSLIELENFGLTEKENNFILKSDFSFPGKGFILDTIIAQRDKDILGYAEEVDFWQFEQTHQAVDLLLSFKGKKVATAGDYDVDGITGNIVLTTYLRKLGFEVLSIVPERQNGYGLTRLLVDKAKAFGAELIITIDNGTSAKDAVDYAHELGIKVLVTDHHLPGEEVSTPDAIINYNLWTDQIPLPGCGVAFMLGSLTAEKLGVKDIEFEKKLLPLVAVAAISDVCPLYGMNRKIVKNHLRDLMTSSNTALKTLCNEVCGDSYYPNIGFGLAPVINSMGRYNRAGEMFDFFFMKNEKQIESKVKELVKFNQFRKEETIRLMSKAEEMLNPFDEFNLIIFSEEEESGLLGIVAGRIQSTTNKPTIVTKKHGDRIHGSARSNDVPLVDLIREVKNDKEKGELDVFAAGHNCACGFGASIEDVEEFKKRMNERLAKEKKGNTIHVDMILSSPLDLDMEEIERMEKVVWGTAYDSPTFATKNMILVEKKQMGSSTHFRFFAEDINGIIHEFVFFGGEKILRNIEEGEQIDILYSVGINTWRGKRDRNNFCFNIRKSR